MRNKIRESLRRRHIFVGAFLNLASPSSAEVMASVGFEWPAVDAEPSPVGLTQIAEMFRATESRSATPVVRAWNHEAEDPRSSSRCWSNGHCGASCQHPGSG